MSYGDPVQLGKISKIRLGNGGYDDAMFGVTITLSFDDGGSGVMDFKGSWKTYPSHAKYSMQEWAATHSETYSFIRDLMDQAKVRDFNDLVGKPVEAKFDFNKLLSWRILTEVL